MSRRPQQIHNATSSIPRMNKNKRNDFAKYSGPPQRLVTCARRNIMPHRVQRAAWLRIADSGFLLFFVQKLKLEPNLESPAAWALVSPDMHMRGPAPPDHDISSGRSWGNVRLNLNFNGSAVCLAFLLFPLRRRDDRPTSACI